MVLGEKSPHLMRMRSLALAAPLGTRSLSLIASSSSFFRRGIVALIVGLLDLKIVKQEMLS